MYLQLHLLHRALTESLSAKEQGTSYSDGHTSGDVIRVFLLMQERSAIDDFNSTGTGGLYFAWEITLSELM